ncbi:hypothetical protein [Rhodopirellula europaea]|uniref:hypothetical protein n=1 Tax=Rhodopirellula europaea TaxID=1263866 RepID=UPI003D2A75D8
MTSTELPEKRMSCRVIAVMKQSLCARLPWFIGGNLCGQFKRGVAEIAEESNRRPQLRDLCFSVCSAFQLSSVPRPTKLVCLEGGRQPMPSPWNVRTTVRKQLPAQLDCIASARRIAEALRRIDRYK